MSEFVEQCRSEWKRLAVSDLLADEMAADLASDLAEAEAEGVSVAEYLGASASDPHSFAASWAAERGIIPAPRSRDNARRRPLALVVFTVLAAIALIVAALLLATGEPKVALVTSKTTSALSTAPTVVPPSHRVQASAAAPVEWILLFVAFGALGFSAWLWSRWDPARRPIVSPRGHPSS